MSLTDTLKTEYLKILSGYDINFFDRTTVVEGIAGYSDIFLPAAPAEWKSGRRVMIVGRETRGWKRPASTGSYDTLERHIDAMVECHTNFSARHGSKNKQNRGETFWNFMRSVGDIVGDGNVAWCNLFCMDFKDTMPQPGQPYYDTVKSLSAQLLKAEINVLQPDVIIFANGGASVLVRREFFPLSGPESVCTDWRPVGMFDKTKLERFTLYGSIDCYRINHPSSISRENRAARTLLLEHLRSTFAASVQRSAI